MIAASAGERVQSLVFVAALAPDEGETVGDVFYRDEPHPKAPQLMPDTHGLIWLPSDAFANAFCHKASPDRAALFAATQRPIAIACIHEKSPRPAWTMKPSWFLVAEDDRMINPDTQRFMARRMDAQIRSAPVDHTPMASAPGLVVEVILDAVRSASGVTAPLAIDRWDR